MNYELYMENGEIICSDNLRTSIWSLRHDARWCRRWNILMQNFRIELNGKVIMEGCIDIGFVWTVVNHTIIHF